MIRFYSAILFLACFAFAALAKEQAEGDGFWEIPLREFESVVKTGSALVIDVREPDEVSEVRVNAKNYINIPLGQVESALQLSEKDYEKTYGSPKPRKEEEITFICRSGRRSEVALNQARNLDYENSRHFQGGTLRWMKEHPGLIIKQQKEEL